MKPDTAAIPSGSGQGQSTERTYKMFNDLLAKLPARNPINPDAVKAVHAPGPDGGIDVEHFDGSVTRATVQSDDGSVICPYCREIHTHGVTDEALSYRTPHCAADVTDRSDYAVLRPERRGLLQAPVNWWRNKRAAPLFMEGKTPGLLPKGEAR